MAIKGLSKAQRAYDTATPPEPIEQCRNRCGNRVNGYYELCEDCKPCCSTCTGKLSEDDVDEGRVQCGDCLGDGEARDE